MSLSCISTSHLHLPYFLFPVSSTSYTELHSLSPSRTCSSGTPLVSLVSRGCRDMLFHVGLLRAVVFFSTAANCFCGASYSGYAISQHRTFYPYFAVFSRTLFFCGGKFTAHIQLTILGRRLRSDCTSPCRGRCLPVRGY